MEILKLLKWLQGFLLHTENGAVVFKNSEMSEQTTLNKMFQSSALIHLELNCTVVNESPGASLHEANWALEELKLAATPD